MLVERHYPSLIKYLAPVSSPMMAHARLMRECYGDIKVVFIGPCYSKKNEVSDPLAGGMVNFAITFEELDGWMAGSQVTFDKTDDAVKGIKIQNPAFIQPPAGFWKPWNHRIPPTAGLQWTA